MFLAVTRLELTFRRREQDERARMVHGLRPSLAIVCAGLFFAWNMLPGSLAARHGTGSQVLSESL